MRYLLILNPGSRGGKSQARFQEIFDFFHKNNLNFDYQLTRSLEDAYTLSVQGNLKGYDVILAVGGDGTINRVIHGFYDAQGKRISRSKLAVLHTGTSPDFCKSYNLPLEIDQALNAVLAGKSMKIPIVKITYLSEYDPSLNDCPLSLTHEKLQTSYFACCANMGLGASVARAANSGIRDTLGDFAGTFLSLIKTLLAYRPVNLTVSIDGEKQVFEKVYNLFVGKTTDIASGIKVKNTLSVEDNRFYTLIIKDLGFWSGVNAIRKLYRGKAFTNNDTMSLQNAEKIEVYGSSSNNELEFDGDPRGFLPCIIEPAQDLLEVIGSGNERME